MNEKDITWDDEITWDSQQQSQQQPQQPQQQNILQQLLQGVGQMATGVINPAYRIAAHTAQGVEGISPLLNIIKGLGGLGGQPGSMATYQNPITGDVVPPYNSQTKITEPIGLGLQGAALVAGEAALGGVMFGAGQGTEEGNDIGEIAVKAALGGLIGKGISVASGKPIINPAIKQILKFDNVSNQAKQAKIALDTLRTTLGQAKQLALQEVKDLPVEFDWGKIPEKAKNAMKNPDYSIEFTQDGKIVNTLGNLDKVKIALQDIPTTRDYVEAGNVSKAKVKQFAGEVRDAMVNTANKAGRPELAKALKDYHEFMDNYSLANDHLVDKYGNAMANKLKATFRLTSEPIVKEAWGNISKSSPEVKAIVKSRKNRELLKALLVTAPTVESGKRLITGRW